jgi:hypothetical protein
VNGPEHYLDAERALGEAKEQPEGSAGERFYLDVAQVHATLALAVAVADASGLTGTGPWAKAVQS